MSAPAASTSPNPAQPQPTLSPLENMLAGGVSGLLARSVVAPLDVIKIRYQLQTVSGSYYSSIPHTIRRIVKEEGVTALWKGNFIASMMSAPYTAIAFSTQKLIKASFASNLRANPRFCVPSTTSNQTTPATAHLNSPNSSPNTSNPQHQQHTHLKPWVTNGINALSGAGAGMVATSITYPLDLLRSRFIAQHNQNRGYSSFYNAVATIYKTNGMGGFFEGISPALLGIVPYMGVQFLIYEGLKSSILEHLPQIDAAITKKMDRVYDISDSHISTGTIDTGMKRLGLYHWKSHKATANEESSRSNTRENQQLSHSQSTPSTSADPSPPATAQNNSTNIPLWIVPFVGLVSGSMGKAVSFPMDLIKRRMQMTSFNNLIDSQSRPLSTQSILQIATKIYQTEGFLAFYKGLAPSVIKSGPSASLSFFFYEAMVNILVKLQGDRSAAVGKKRVVI